MWAQRIIAGLVLFGFGLTVATAAEPKKIGTIEGLTEYQLDNGLKVVIFPEPSVAKVTVNMTILVGSRHEGYGEAGMAHLLEHMLFKPTPSHARPDQELEARGAQYNGTTWADRTNYYEILPASDDNLDWAIAWEADRLVNCPIKAEDLASEMTVVRNEFEMGENRATAVLEQRMFATAFEWHNYGKSTIGNRADIERVPADSLRAFYKKYYRPDNVVLFVGGRLDEAKTLAMVQKHFGKLKSPSEPVRLTYTDEPAQDGERSVTLRRVGNVGAVGVVYHIPSAADADFAATAILEATLTADKTGRLYKSLVERRRASKIEGVAYAWHDPCAIFISAEVVPGNEPATVIEALNDTIDDVVTSGITEAEVSRAKLQFQKMNDQLTADASKLLVHLTEWAGAGDWRLFFLNRDRLANVTVDDVNRVAKKYLQVSNRTTGIYLPTKEAQRTPISSPPDAAALVKDYKGRQDSQVAEVFDASLAAIESRIKRSSIDGIKVAMLPKKTRGGTVALQLRLRYGSDDKLFGLTPVCELLPTLMARATKKYSSEQLADKLDELQSSLSATGGPGELKIVIQSKRQQLSQMIELLEQVLREPTLLPSDFDLIKEQRATELEAHLDDPQLLAPRAVNQKLNPYPTGDVRSIPSPADELRSIKEADILAIRKLYNQFLSTQAGELVVVGDFEPEQTMKSMTSILAGWTSKNPYQRIVRHADQQAKPEYIQIKTPDKANAMYFAGLVLPMRDDDSSYPAMVIGNEVLGGSGFASRLMSRIREKEGLSYGVASIFRSSPFDVRATFGMYAIANPDNMPKVVTLAREEVELLLKNGVTESELTESQQGWIKSRESDRGDDMKLAEFIGNTLYAGRTMEFQAKLEDKIRKLSRDDVQSALRKFIDPSKLVVAVGGDLKD